MTLKFTFRRNLYLEFSDDALETFKDHRQGENQSESGGILIGRIFKDSHVLIELATTPTGYDKASRYGFESSQRASQKIVNTIWHRSKGESIYLGEWHSHPELVPKPSSRDKQMIRNMFNQSKIETDFLFLVVSGINDIWVGSENGLFLKKLKKTIHK